VTLPRAINVPQPLKASAKLPEHVEQVQHAGDAMLAAIGDCTATLRAGRPYTAIDLHITLYQQFELGPRKSLVVGTTLETPGKSAVSQKKKNQPAKAGALQCATDEAPLAKTQWHKDNRIELITATIS